MDVGDVDGSPVGEGKAMSVDGRLWGVSMVEEPPAGVTLCPACEKAVGPGGVNLVCRLCGGLGFRVDWRGVCREYEKLVRGEKK